MAGDHHHRSIDADGEEPEAALFLTYPCTTLYYVQSPSTHSHDNESAAFVSPYRTENFMISNTNTTNQDVNRFMLSRYSSSRESNTTSFLHEKKIVYDIQCHDDNDIGVEEIDEDDLRRRICKVEELREVEEEEDDDYDGRRKGCWRYFSFSTSSSCIWISIQIFWRLMVSFGIALFVFFLATKPPSPKMSIKIAGIREFGLTEGVDGSGVTTKILSCNCSMVLQVDNKSKLFGLHIRSSAIQISFGTFIFANSQTPKLYADNDRSTTFELHAGTKNKAMYGAGRSMQDMLESGKGLPFFISMNLRSNYHVVRNFIKPKFKHRVECLLVLRGAYDKKHRTQAYNSSCRISSTT